MVFNIRTNVFLYWISMRLFLFLLKWRKPKALFQPILCIRFSSLIKRNTSVLPVTREYDAIGHKTWNVWNILHHFDFKSIIKQKCNINSKSLCNVTPTIFELHKLYVGRGGLTASSQMVGPSFPCVVMQCLVWRSCLQSLYLYL